MSTMTDPFPRNANSAGAPLPHIPRRSASASRVNSITPSASPVKITVQLASPPEMQKSSKAVESDSEDSSSSSSASRLKGAPKKALSFRPKRGRTLQPVNCALSDFLFPASDSKSAHSGLEPSDRLPMSEKSGTFVEKTSTSEASSIASSNTHSLIYRKGMPLKFTLDQLKSDIRDANGTAQTHMGAPVTAPPVIRKKSGQLVKSSLKASKPVARGSLSVVTGAVASKSEPATPKAVHFDAHLEHVKLFLAEQKPLAVSRDGSPTDETSGTESDFPPFPFGESSDEKKVRKRLVMQVANLPSVVDRKADVALLELKLEADSTSIAGKVRVRNIAFQKWVAVRFTFDAWQTTSEVTGRYVESQKDFDIFAFSIRLDGLMARIDGKTLILAVRYAVAGQEFWDNNGGQNYLATFSFSNPPVAKKLVIPESVTIADLKSRLEKVVRNQERGRFDPSHDTTPTRKSRDGLSSRYDFHASLKESLLSSPGTHVRTHSSPMSPRTKSLSPPPSLSRSFVQRTMVEPKITLGSPRDLDRDTFRPAPFVPSDLEDPPFSTPPVTRVARNHQGSYFELEIPPSLSSSVRRTPPTPRLRDDGTRSHSFPPFLSLIGLGLTPRDAATAESAGSDQSTPSILSPSASSRSTSPSSSSPIETFGMTDFAARVKERPVDDGTSYNEFLDKFCFYTGSDSTSPDNPGKPFLEISTNPNPADIPRDDSASRSGSATPTSFYFDIPEISTPVML